jgi:AraC-like DNA-binding protein
LPEAARDLARVGALAIPFAIWLTARLYFEDGFQPRPAHGMLLAALVAVRALVQPWPVAASGLAAVAVLDALRRIHAGAGSDLLLTRLRLRFVVLLGTGVYALAVLLAEAVVTRGSRTEGLLGAANDIGLLLLAAVVSLSILRVEPGLLRGVDRSPSTGPVAILEKRLERLIEDEQIFRTEGLTIAAVAERLGEQEYKVRQLVNTRLGFRNFGAFLNHYRVREARTLLADPAQKRLGVAEIAFRLGYSSLGPFNRAFKEIVGRTPTEYRRASLEPQTLADSATGQPSSKGG